MGIVAETVHDAEEDLADCFPRFGHKISPLLATFYAVRNQKGQFYRTYDKNRSSGWKDKLEDARLWTTLSPARSKVTALANEYPNLPVPELVEFIVREVNVVDQRERVAKTRQKKQEEKARNEEYWKKAAVVEAQKELEAVQAKLKKLRGE